MAVVEDIDHLCRAALSLAGGGTSLRPTSVTTIAVARVRCERALANINHGAFVFLPSYWLKRFLGTPAAPSGLLQRATKIQIGTYFEVSSARPRVVNLNHKHCQRMVVLERGLDVAIGEAE